MSHDVRLSKWLSYVLRHGALKENLKLDEKGFIAVADIVKHKGCTVQQIKDCVEYNEKKRFQLEERTHGLYIRASQGHSITLVDPDLKLITDPAEIPVVVHGTTRTAYESIKKTGLNKMARTHIHFAHGSATDPTVVSGMRKTSQVMIYIDSAKAMGAGIKFYLSANGVILSDGINGVIHPQFFEKIEQV
jgi:2'-phosphotransferase